MNIKLDQINEPSKSYGQSVPKKNQSDKGDKDQEKDVDQIDYFFCVDDNSSMIKPKTRIQFDNQKRKQSKNALRTTIFKISNNN